MKSWKTSVAGVGSILAGIASILGVITGQPGSIEVGVGLIMAGIVGLQARDNSVTSARAGAR
jgi:hypothetical protein